MSSPGSPSVQSKIQQNPKFAQLVAKRTRFALVLTMLVLVPYYGFMMVVAFAPQWLHAKLGADMATTVGWPIGVAMIVGAWILTGIYIRRANGEFDALNQEVLKEAR